MKTDTIVHLIKTVDRYIFGCVMRPLISLTLLIIGIVWLSQSLRFLELIVNNSVGIKTYLNLILYLIPDLFSTLFPICLLICGVQIYQKMIADNEIAVLRSSGFSNVQIARPFLIVCALGTAFCLLSNIFIIPEAYKKFSVYQHQIRGQLSAAMIKPGTFNQIQGVTVYVRERQNVDELKGVFIHVNDTPEKSGYVITAEEGRLKRMGDQLILMLMNGARQEINKKTNGVVLSGFESFSYDLTPLIKGNDTRSVKPMERSLKELLNPVMYEQDQLTQKRLIAEGHQRILIPFLCILNGLVTLSILLYGDLRRRQRKRKVALSILVAGLIQIALIGILNGSSKNPSLIGVSYATLMACIIFFGIMLCAPKGVNLFKGSK